MSNLFSAGSSKARRLGALSTLAVSALLFSACASENSTAQSSSPATPSASASTSASAAPSSSATDAQASASSSRIPDQGSSEANPSASTEATSSDGQKLEEIYTGSEDMKKASPVPTDNAEVKKTTELVNSYEDILSKVKPAPSAAASQEATSEPTSDEDAQAQNTEKARAVLDEDTIRAIENIAVDSAASEFAVQASEYALAGWHYEGSSTVVGTPRMADTEYKGQPARLLEVCMDSSSVKIYDENNQPVKDDSSPKRSLNIYTLVQVNGQWKIATHDFPNNPDC